MSSIGTIGTMSANAIDDLRPIYRKIAFRLMPILMLLWIMAWIDRVNISFAKLQMMEELRFSDAVYGLGAGIFFIGYLMFEIPSNLLLQKIGARRTIARIAIGWGITCVLMSIVTTPFAFYALRLLLGAFEAGFFPGVIVYLTLWFPSDRRAKIFGIFMSSVALSGVLGGPFAGFVMSTLHGHIGLSGWQWLFILEGIPTVLTGIFCLFYLTDSLEQAQWLELEERAAIASDLERDKNGFSNREHRFRAIILDRRLWTFTIIYFCVIIGNATVAFWGPTIIRETGITNITTIGWVVSGASLLGSAAMILNGVIADRTRRPLILCILSLLLASVSLAILAAFLHKSETITILAFALALAGAYGAIPVFWQIPNRLFTGTAAAGGIALINSFGNLGGFLAPYGLGLAANEMGDVTVGLLAVSVVISLAALGTFAARRFFTPGTI